MLFSLLSCNNELYFVFLCHELFMSLSRKIISWDNEIISEWCALFSRKHLFPSRQPGKICLLWCPWVNVSVDKMKLVRLTALHSVVFIHSLKKNNFEQGKKAQNWCRNSDLKLVLLRLLYGAQNDCVISLETTISWSQENIKCNSSSQENMSDPWPFRASILSAVDRWFERWLASCYFCTYQRLQVTQMLMACPWDPF